MLKNNLVLASTALLSGILLATTSSVVSAASASGNGDGIETVDGSANATTSAEFNVEEGKLSFDAAPDFNFGSNSILDVIKGQMNQEDNVIAEDHNDSHTTTVGEENGSLSKSNDILQISDYRGAGSSWKLTAAMTPFTNKSGKGSVVGEISLPGLNAGAKIGATPTTVWDSTTANTGGLGTKTVNLSKGASLELSNPKEIQAGKYDATINWSLQNTTIVASEG